MNFKKQKFSLYIKRKIVMISQIETHETFDDMLFNAFATNFHYFLENSLRKQFKLWDYFNGSVCSKPVP